MEHRWGARTEISVPVRLYAGARRISEGRIVDLSLSGAFIATRAPVAVFTRLELVADELPLSAQPCRIPAYVVRQSEEGVGLEWCDFAPAPFRALLGLLGRLSLPDSEE